MSGATSEVAVTHTCFNPPLPALPIGYKFDTEQPLKLVPFGQFAAVLQPINICRKCYIYAFTHFQLVAVNKASAERTASSPAAVALGNMPRYTGVVNSCQHPMFDDINPPALREGRRLAMIIGHEARRGDSKKKPRLSYVVKYQICDDPRLSAKVRVTETKLRQYTGAMALLTVYWYGNRPHTVNNLFIRSVLTRLTPFANSAIWNKLPVDESLCLHYLHQAGKLHEWKAGMTVKTYRASQEGSA